MLNRRHLIQALGGSAALSSLGALKVAHASLMGESRFVLVILRGAMDGLHALVPYGDPNYAKLRRSIAVPRPGARDGAIDLDGHFGLHPALAPLYDLYRKKELLPVPAVSTRYRDRSHFDAQNVLENGTGKPYGAHDGWLNRAISQMQGNRRLGLSIGPTVPLVLQGKTGVQAWSESSLPSVSEDFLGRLEMMYSMDPLFAKALEQGRMAGDVDADLSATGAKSKQAAQFITASKAAADLLSQPSGPRIAVVESHGWDTHYSQMFRMDALLDGLAKGIMSFHDALGYRWKDTTIMVVSEFGRTAAQNGSQGTDHGTGGLALLAGGTVNGGRIGGDWPGLAPNQLLQGRDVRPTTDYDSIFKAVLQGPLGMSSTQVEREVFPDSGSLKPAQGLF